MRSFHIHWSVAAPATVFIDEKGSILGVINGPANWAYKKAIKLIESSMALREAS